MLARHSKHIKDTNSVAFELKQAVMYDEREHFNVVLTHAVKGDGNQALEEAIERNRLGYVNDLIGVTDECVLGGYALTTAAGYGHSGIVRALVGFADDEVLKIALCGAIVRQHTDTVVVLMEHVDCTYDHSLPLQLAARLLKSPCEDHPILDALYSCSNPQDALDALRDCFSTGVARQALELRINLAQNAKIHGELNAVQPSKPRKI